MWRYLGLLLCAVAVLHAQGGAWKWKDRDGQERTRDELTERLLKTPADLHGATLSSADLKGKRLERADLSGTILQGANLTGANLRDAKLIGADLSRAIFNSADLSGADLTDAILFRSDFSDSLLTDASRAGSKLSRVLSAHPPFATLNLSRSAYEPASHPSPEEIAYAVGLGYLTWSKNSGPIYALRKSLEDAGFRDAARQVTAAIHRHDQNWIERVAFDWTCEWGANCWRPLGWVATLCVLCTLIYWAGLHFGRRSGLYLVATGQRITTSKGKEHVFHIAFLRPRPAKWYRYIPRLMGREMRAVRTALFFSLMRVFNIGFREFNFGRWIGMIQPREFDLRARGWMRTVSGIQSLLGVVLTALSVLSYFGHPFG